MAALVVAVSDGRSGLAAVVPCPGSPAPVGGQRRGSDHGGHDLGGDGEVVLAYLDERRTSHVGRVHERPGALTQAGAFVVFPHP